MKAQDLRAKQRLDCDLVAVGGGAAGVTTATVAVGAGLRVILITRHSLVGAGQWSASLAQSEGFMRQSPINPMLRSLRRMDLHRVFSAAW
ncbi:FAD-dependent oxidoreductase [Sulfitobacter mediterraneus]